MSKGKQPTIHEYIHTCMCVRTYVVPPISTYYQLIIQVSKEKYILIKIKPERPIA